MTFVSTRTIAESQSVATPRDCRFDVFRGGLESAAQLDRLRQFRPRGLRRGNPFANQLRDRVLEFLVLIHSANFYRAHEVIWKIEGGLHCQPDSQKSGFLSTAPLRLAGEVVGRHCFASDLGATTFCTSASKRGSPCNESSSGSTLIQLMLEPSRSFKSCSSQRTASSLLFRLR